MMIPLVWMRSDYACLCLNHLVLSLISDENDVLKSLKVTALSRDYNTFLCTGFHIKVSKYP